MDFLDKARAFKVPYASALFIMANGQAHAILIKRDVEKERVLPALQFSIHREAGHLVALKRDEGVMCVKALTSPGKKARRKKRARGKTRCKHEKGQIVERDASSHPNQVKRTSPGNKRHARQD